MASNNPKEAVVSEPLHQHSPSPPDFSDLPFHQNFIVAGKRLLRRAVKNATCPHIKRRSSQLSTNPGYHPSTRDFPR
jgi:hypothetical protein